MVFLMEVGHDSIIMTISRSVMMGHSCPRGGPLQRVNLAQPTFVDKRASLFGLDGVEMPSLVEKHLFFFVFVMFLVVQGSNLPRDGLTSSLTAS